MNVILTLILAMGFFSQNTTMAWGGRGHHSVCEAAVHLVKTGIKDYLKNKPQVMGHLCNIPDIYWKQLPKEIRKEGDPAHYINAEKIGLKLKDMPLDYKKIISEYTGKPNLIEEGKTLFSVPEELGSSWWRADQMYRLAIEAGKGIKDSASPKNFSEEQDENLPYNKAMYNMVNYLGIMGHFVGDNGQPFHTSSDHDGYGAGHGGIHSYYEDSVVAEFGPDLVLQIVNKAKGFKKEPFLNTKNSVIENMRELSVLSVKDIPLIYKADPILSPSKLSNEKGMSLKTVAKRKDTSVAFKKMDKLIVNEMARSAALLALIWDNAYEQVGSPSIKGYKSYKYPFTPEYIKPDYL